MDLHRVRRLAWVLVASQVRSGGRSADPRSPFGQPGIFAWLDLGLGVGVFAVGTLGLRYLAIPPGELAPWVITVLPFLPLFAVASVLVAGVMFELTTTTKFAGSDAANWLPLRPEEYVLASSVAVAYTYSPAVALVLGAVAAVGVYVGTGALVALAGGLALAALLEGAFLVEIVRSTSQGAGASSARRGRVALLLRAVVLVIVIVALQLVFNPVFLFASLRGLSSFGDLTAYLPPFWGTFAILTWAHGSSLVSLLFAAAAVAFAGSLLYLATRLRARVLVGRRRRVPPGGPSLRRRAPGPPGARPLSGRGRDGDEGLPRVRADSREMLPLLVLPVVLLVVVFLENGVSGSGIGSLGVVVFTGWATAFFALLLATTSVGQERKAIWTLFAAPLPAGSVFRAKLVRSVAPGVGCLRRGGRVGGPSLPRRARRGTRARAHDGARGVRRRPLGPVVRRPVQRFPGASPPPVPSSRSDARRHRLGDRHHLHGRGPGGGGVVVDGVDRRRGCSLRGGGGADRDRPWVGMGPEGVRRPAAGRSRSNEG